MSDIEILLRELIEKIDNLEKKIDKLLEQNKPLNISMTGMPLGNDTIPLPLRTTEEMRYNQ